MPTVDSVMPEELRARLQRAQLNPRCHYLDGKVYVKLSVGNYYNPTNTGEITIKSGNGRDKILREAKRLLGKPLPT